MITALHLLGGGLSRHHYPAPTPAVVRSGPPVDTRPRQDYHLPDGMIVRVIIDHGEVPARTITYQRRGEILIATRVDGAVRS